MADKEIKLGDKVKDVITGYTGIAMGITKYLTGCDHVGVLSQTAKDKDGKPTNWQWFDITVLKVVKAGVIKLDSGTATATPKRQGGPAPEAPSR